MKEITHLSMTELEMGMDYIRQSPKEEGALKMIVRRPHDNKREIVESAEIDEVQGLLGDNWKARGSKHTPDGSADFNAQITLMNSRSIELMAQDQEHWPLAGDQLYVDINLGEENLPPGTRLEIGSIVLEVTAQPHTGCQKFSARFGLDALKFVNSPEGRQLHLRGINTRVLKGGVIHVGDIIRRV